MKECCKPAFEEKPSQLKKWLRRGVYLLVILLLIFVAWNQFKIYIT